MKYIRVEPRNADAIKKNMMHLKLFDSSRAVIHSRSYVYFPTLDIKHAKNIKLIGRLGGSVISRRGRKTARERGYGERISEAIGKAEYAKLSRGYDQMGNIAIIEFNGKRENERKIASIMMHSNSSIKTVMAKAGAVSGKYRIRKLRYVAGARNYIANYSENNCMFRFDVRKVYFSNRLSFERSRILKLVKTGENVMVMFAGVGPFAIEIAKNIKGTNVVAIELNRQAYRYMVENIELNRLENVRAVYGDVKKAAGRYSGFADRIIMPLPGSSLEFLDQAYRVANKNSTVHLYAFSGLEDPFDGIISSIMSHSKRKKYRAKVLSSRVVRPYSARECEVVIDYSIKKR